MFGIGTKSDLSEPTEVTAQQLAGFAPYSGISDDVLNRLAGEARFHAIRGGKLPGRWFDRRVVYLFAGEIQLRTPNGRRLFLSSVSPPARFPLPPPGKATINTVEPATFIVVPDIETGPVGARQARRLLPDDDPRLGSLCRIVESRIDAGDIPLPSMPDLAMRLAGALRDGEEGHDSQDIAKLIQLDPALATKIIHVVNSAAFRFARRAETVQQAVTRLGQERVRNLAIGFLLRNAFDTDSASLRKRANAVWLNSCHVAAVSFTLAHQLPMLDPERAMLAGLVHRIGALPILGLARQYPDLFSTHALIDRVTSLFSRELSEYVLRRWDLGDDMMNVVSHSDDWQHVGYALPEYTDVVLLAQLHASIGKPAFGELPRIDALPAFRKLEMGKLTPRKSLQALDDARREILELRRILSRHG